MSCRSVIPLMSLVALLFVVSRPEAALADDRDCGNLEKSPDASIEACTKIIQSKQIGGSSGSNEDLVKAYSSRAKAYFDKGETDKGIADLNEARAHSKARKKSDTEKALDEVIQNYDPDEKTQAFYISETGEKKFDCTLVEANVLERITRHEIGSMWNMQLIPIGSPYGDHKGDHNKIIAAYSKIIEDSPKNTMAYMFRGKVWARNGNHDKAIADFSQAIKLEPENATAYCCRGISHYYKGDYGKAIADNSEAIRLNPRNVSAEVARHLHPRNVSAYLYRGKAYADSGEYGKAITDYNESIKLDPEYAAAYNHRAQAYLKSGQAKEALADAHKSVEFDAKNHDAWNKLGTIQEALGKKDEAIDAYKKAMELDPKHEAGREHLIRLGALK